MFNVEQIEGLPDHYYAEPPKVIDPVLRIEHADSFFAKTGADVRHGGKAPLTGALLVHYQGELSAAQPND